MRRRVCVIACLFVWLLLLCPETTTLVAFGEDREIPAQLADTALSAGPCPSCSQVAGDWTAHEYGTVTCVTDGQQTVSFSSGDSYLMTTWQSGCNLDFRLEG